MPVDGSYGRLSAHKKRVEDFRRKKEFQKKKLDAFRLKSKNKLDFGEFNEKDIKSTKQKIRLEAKTKRFKEAILLILSIILIAFITYLFFKS